MCMWMESLFIVVSCEALVQLWFTAAPLQWIREVVIATTPFLYSKKQGTHLLNCRYCVSVWIGLLITVLYYSMNSKAFIFTITVLSVHRLSNFLHLIFSLLRDRQIDIRVARSNNYGRD